MEQEWRAVFWEGLSFWGAVRGDGVGSGAGPEAQGGGQNPRVSEGGATAPLLRKSPWTSSQL